MLHLWRDEETRPVVAASLTLGIAVGVFAISFGVGAVTADATVFQACAISVLVFTGASQFSAISVLIAGGSYPSAIGGALVLGARNGVYGLAMAPHMRGRLGTRLIAAQLTLDESTSMAMAQPDERMRRIGFWVTGTTVFIFWNLGTLAGALAGRAIDIEKFGLDAAFPAAYVAMVWPLLRERRARLAAGLGMTICLVLIPLTPIGVPILCAALAVLVGIPAPPVVIGERAEPAHDGRATDREPFMDRVPGSAPPDAMSWWFILALAAGCYGFKVIGMVLVGDRSLPPVVARCLALIPAAMISALVALNTFSDGQELVIDARAAGVAAAIIAAWRKAPLIVVIVLGAAVTAVVRALA